MGVKLSISTIGEKVSRHFHDFWAKTLERTVFAWTKKSSFGWNFFILKPFLGCILFVQLESLFHLPWMMLTATVD